MFKIVIVCFGLHCILGVHSYVILQVRRFDNKSDVDAIIHKVIPIEKTNSSLRKHYEESAEESDSSDGETEKGSKKLDDVVFSVDTSPKIKNAGYSPLNINVDSKITSLMNVLKDFVTGNKNNVIYERAKEYVSSEVLHQISSVLRKIMAYEKDLYQKNLKPYVKPGIVHFRDGKDSVLVELNTNTLMDGVKEVLANPKVRQMGEKLTRKAAILYRTIANELRQKNREEED